MAKKEGNTEGPRRIVLVGTYRDDQLKDWPGWYCWPLDDDVSAAKNAKGKDSRRAAEPQRENPALSPQGPQSVLGASGQRCVPGALREGIPEWLHRVTELWLYKGTADERRYRAEFVGVKTREELIRDYGYPGGGDLSHAEAQRRRDGRGKRPACPKPHGTHYALFKTELLYRHKNDLPGEADAVVVRASDFVKRSPKIAKQLKAYLESPDRKDPDLAKRLPEIITKLRPEQLHVCEAAVQLEFDLLSPMIIPAKTSAMMDSQGSGNICELGLGVVGQFPSSVMSVEEMKDKIFQGDCLNILPKFPAASVDMILCDLPYGTTQNKWDSVIPLDLLWAEYKRILKPNGSVVLTSQGLFTAKLVLSNANWFKYKIVWVKSKPTNFLNAKVQPLRKHEDVCVFYGQHCTYNPIMGEGVPYDKGVRKNQLSGSYGDFRPVHVQSSGKRYPTDVVYFKTAESEGEVWHPTQKPVALGRYLVKTFSNPGDLILDNAFGSGSFLVAAALENRHFVGIEKNESVALFKEKAIDYIEVAKLRLSGVLKRMEVS